MTLHQCIDPLLKIVDIIRFFMSGFCNVIAEVDSVRILKSGFSALIKELVDPVLLRFAGVDCKKVDQFHFSSVPFCMQKGEKGEKNGYNLCQIHFCLICHLYVR